MFKPRSHQDGRQAGLYLPELFEHVPATLRSQVLIRQHYGSQFLPKTERRLFVVGSNHVAEIFDETILVWMIATR